MAKRTKLLKIRAAAEILSVHPETLRRWDRQGKLTAVRIGSRKDRRYQLQDIAGLLKQK